MTIGGLVNMTARSVFSQPTTSNWISRCLLLFEVAFFSCSSVRSQKSSFDRLPQQANKYFGDRKMKVDF